MTNCDKNTILIELDSSEVQLIKSPDAFRISEQLSRTANPSPHAHEHRLIEIDVPDI